MWLVVLRELNFFYHFSMFFYSTDSFELNKFNWNQQLTQIPQWIHLDSSMNSVRFLNEFTQIPQWIHWGIWVNLLRNPSEFIEESEWIHWEISGNLLGNRSEFIEEFEWIVDFNWICFIQRNLLNKKILKWLKNSVLARQPIHISACYL